MAKVVIILFLISLILGLGLLLAWPFMWIWNYAVVQAVTFANPITYWPAYWLICFFSFLGMRASSSSNK